MKTYEEMIKDLAGMIKFAKDNYKQDQRQFDHEWGYAHAVATMFGKTMEEIYSEACDLIR